MYDIEAASATVCSNIELLYYAQSTKLTERQKKMGGIRMNEEKKEKHCEKKFIEQTFDDCW